MSDNFEQFFRFLCFWEGEYSDDPHDPGGLTIYGISRAAFPKEVEQMKQLFQSGRKEEAKEIAKTIARQRYWNTLDCNNLPSGLDVIVADTAFNAGELRAKQILEREKQRARDILATFEFNEITLGITQLGNFVKNYICAEYILERYDFYDDFTNFSRYGRGWSKRMKSLYDFVISDFKILKHD